MTNKPITTPANRPVILCILDGWGNGSDGPNNAIARAATPNWDRLIATNPHSHLQASAHFVGLPDGQMGNSEVGHMNIGAGRVVMQDFPKINAAIADGSLASNAALKDFIDRSQNGTGRVHLLGLLSAGGVHAHQDHIQALHAILSAHGMDVIVHALTDGRDAPPKEALTAYQAFVEKTPSAKIGTLSGRYFAMDRDKNWDRISPFFHAFIAGKGHRFQNAADAIQAAYGHNTSDEFIPPCCIDGYDGVKAGDSLLIANFRADRIRQILQALVMPDFEYFDRQWRPNWSATLGMVEYSSQLAQRIPAIFPPEKLPNTLGDYVAQHGLKQLRIAETEKYAHVTFFLNGGSEAPFAGETRVLVPSPKVATYDLQPEMSALPVTDKLVAAIKSADYALIVVNYANTDMVGHTGNLPAAIKAVETIDGCLGRVEKAVLAVGGTMLVTADHGNIEQMWDDNINQAHTAHTTNTVPLVLVGSPNKSSLQSGLQSGKLADLAPTVLTLMGLAQPTEMTGKSLIENAEEIAKKMRTGS